MKGGGCKGGELPFIYKTLDLDCVENLKLCVSKIFTLPPTLECGVTSI